MFRVAPFITAPNGNCPNDPDRRITHSMKCSMPVTMNELQIHLTMWVNLTNLKLSERRQTSLRRSIYYRTLLRTERGEPNLCCQTSG